MKKIIVVLFLSIASLNLAANFIVQNNTGNKLNVLINYNEDFNDPRYSETEYQASDFILPTILLPHQKETIDTAEKNYSIHSIEFTASKKELNYFIPSSAYGEILKKAKQFMPTITITEDLKTGELIANFPQNVLALQEAIKKEKSLQISKKVKEAVPQFPSSEEGAGRVTGLIGYLAAEEEE